MCVCVCVCACVCVCVCAHVCVCVHKICIVTNHQHNYCNNQDSTQSLHRQHLSIRDKNWCFHSASKMKIKSSDDQIRSGQILYQRTSIRVENSFST